MNTQNHKCATSNFVSGLLIHLSVFICVHLWFLFFNHRWTLMDTDLFYKNRNSCLANLLVTTNGHEWTRMILMVLFLSLSDWNVMLKILVEKNKKEPV
ncbi:MAG: hypothetical protein CSA81_07245 [Acidobacteria bacterium]|nr:MAG: hypothetical protein CSA81_07245 [Acidobacteriota bacterium]